MKATVLVDNIGMQGAPGEWGLSIYVEHRDQKLLLDTGSSTLFLENAKKLGIALEDVDGAVLSHAHYDHANGMRAFLETNGKAPFYLRDGAGENCYKKIWFFYKYIGIPRNILKDYPERIRMVKGNAQLMEGVYLIPHDTPGLDKIGKANSMYVKKGRTWKPDDFSHEQSLVFDLGEELVVFNSCSHGGADNIIREVSKQLHKPVRALIGGFHIFGKSAEEVRALAGRIKETGVKEIYTGHCTGKSSFRILQEELGDMVKQLHVGLTIDFEEKEGEKINEV